MSNSADSQRVHDIGSVVVYGMHGKCKVIGIESRSVGGETLSLYKLEPIRAGVPRPAGNRREPAIWVPIHTAASLGLRTPLAKESIQSIEAVLTSREYYFSLDQPWHVVHGQLESTIRKEGAIGLAKAHSFLFVLRKRLVVTSGEIAKFSENVARLLYREICDLTGENAKSAEERINKMMRHKLLPDQ